MQGLRSRAGTVAMTACAFALLSVPVIALGKGPPEVKGGGTETATTVVPPEAKVPSPPPGQVDNPAPKPAPAGQAKPKPAPKPTPPGQAKRQAAAPAPAPGRGPDGSGPPGHAGKKSGPPPHGRARGHAKHRPSAEPVEGSSDPGSAPAQPGGGGTPDEPPRSPSDREPDVTGGIDLPSADDVITDDGEADDGEADVAGALVGDTVDLPEDASPETLPFTGLGLAFIALGGLAALAGGLMLRRRVVG
jgi:hypothetical protein